MLRTLLDVWHDFVSHTPFLMAALMLLLLTWLLSAILRGIAVRLMQRAQLRPSLAQVVSP